MTAGTRSEGDKMRELEIEAKDETLEQVLGFVDETLEEMECPMKTQTQIEIAVEEIFVNIAHYAYGGEPGPARITIETQEDPRGVIIGFSDEGVPYDPLAKPDPDVTLSAEERQIGGLGIYMVKKSMDKVTYASEDGKNILHIRKNF